MSRRKVYGHLAYDVEEVDAELTIRLHAAFTHTYDERGVGNANVLDTLVVCLWLHLQGDVRKEEEVEDFITYAYNQKTLPLKVLLSRLIESLEGYFSLRGYWLPTTA